MPMFDVLDPILGRIASHHLGIRFHNSKIGTIRLGHVRTNTWNCSSNWISSLRLDKKNLGIVPQSWPSKTPCSRQPVEPSKSSPSVALTRDCISTSSCDGVWEVLAAAEKMHDIHVVDPRWTVPNRGTPMINLCCMIWERWTLNTTSLVGGVIHDA